MKKYKVFMSEVRYGSVVVEAVCEDEAKVIAEKEWESGRVVWNDNEISDLTAEEAGNNEM